MATLHEVLSKSSPDIAEDAVTQFRAGLVFIINRLHDEDAEGIQHSLLDQKKKLDDEGYDSCTFLTILNQVTEATIGSSASQELLFFIQENIAEPDGLPLLLAHVHSSLPELAQAIDELETLAIEEENQLLAMAGGMSKKVEVTLITTGVLGLGGLTIAGYRKVKSMLAERAVREEQAAKDKFHSDISSNEISELWDYNRDTLMLEATNSVSENTVNAIQRDPDLLIKQSKSLEKYTTSDIEGHAEQLAIAHFYKFEIGLKSQVEEAFKGEIRKFEDSLRESTKFKNKFRSKLVEKGIDDNLGWDNVKKMPGFGAMEKEVLNDNGWSRIQVQNYPRDYDGLMDAMKNAFDEIKKSYVVELSKEVKALQKELRERAEARLEDTLRDLDSEGNYMRKAELKVDSDIVSKTKELKEVISSDVRVFGGEVKADVRATERRGSDIGELF